MQAPDAASRKQNRPKGRPKAEYELIVSLQILEMSVHAWRILQGIVNVQMQDGVPFEKTDFAVVRTFDAHGLLIISGGKGKLSLCLTACVLTNTLDQRVLWLLNFNL
jgi:hypothetical protein